MSTSVPFALIGAAVTLLDDIATSVVAAATASVYISDQSRGIVAADWMTIVLLGVIAAVGLIGVILVKDYGANGAAMAQLVGTGLALLLLVVGIALAWRDK